MSLVVADRENVPEREQVQKQFRNLRKVYHCPHCGDLLIGVPLLTCAHCGHAHPLRAYFYSPRPGEYIAECIDLDLLSQGNTPEQAVGKLQEAMASYLIAAFDGGFTKGLALRPSPLSHRLHYQWRCFVKFVEGIFKNRHNKYFMFHGPEADNFNR